MGMLHTDEPTASATCLIHPMNCQASQAWGHRMNVFYVKIPIVNFRILFKNEFSPFIWSFKKFSPFSRGIEN